MPPSSDARLDLPAEVVARLPEGVDLHARPAADFVRCAMRFEASLEAQAGAREANAKSLLAVLALGAKGGSDLRLRAQGEDAPAALEALAACVSGLS